jgi:cobalt-zinc-cadmium efflux system protein
MGHQHSHSTGQNIKVALFLNLGFTIFEIIGGLLTNSVAILSDALHDFGDSVSLGLAWLLERFSERDSDNTFSYGYERFSAVGALINAVILIVGSVFILSAAIPRLADPQESSAPGMILVSIIGIGVNGAAVLRLKGDRSLNARMVAWHLLEDVLGWIAILVVGIVLVFFDIPALDPALSIILTAYVLVNVFRNLKETLAVFLQATPRGVDLEAVKGKFLGLDGVQSVHHVHVWSLDGDHHVLTAHLVVDDGATKDDVMAIKCEAKLAVGDIHLEHITIEVEFETEDCVMRDG